MCEAQTVGGPSFGVLTVRSTERRREREISDQREVDTLWEEARRAAREEREQRNSAAHK